MDTSTIIASGSQALHRLTRDVKELAHAHREKLPYLAIGLALLTTFVVSKARETHTYVYRNEGRAPYKQGRILSFQGSSIYEGKERVFSKTVSGIQANETALKEQLAKLQSQVEQLSKARTEPVAGPSGTLTQAAGQSAGISTGTTPPSPPPPIRVSSPPELEAAERAAQLRIGDQSPFVGHGTRSTPGVSSRQGRASTSILSFPVKEVAAEATPGIVLPAGSYVKAKLMTGIEAPEGKTNPVLLQLDYAFIGPNRHRIDLSGCFMIVKSQGDLSTERVQMQASKLSCVSKDGKMFERDVSGFVADDKDNSFAVMGSVNSKQDRVASMAFLSSIVQGVGQAIQQAQTTSQVTPLGGSQSVLTGSSAEYMAAGGAANAASLVTQWYLKQAQNLLPTINIGSGQDVWVVMLETVKLPANYFRKNTKGDSDEGAYTYLTRVLD